MARSNAKKKKNKRNQRQRFLFFFFFFRVCFEDVRMAEPVQKLKKKKTDKKARAFRCKTPKD